jgi:transketolase
VRTVFCDELVAQALLPAFVFLTGDLGYKALEPLRTALNKRFINAGVAEQNMVSVAAGLARQGLRPWVYSIAPFSYARPFEQIRNDVCLHRLPVVVVGNGGGYGYGVMGATHHALEDYGTLLTLQNLRAFIPATDADLVAQIRLLMHVEFPAYLRLGLSELPADAALPPYAPWRKLLAGDGPTIVVVGPLVGSLLTAARELPQQTRPNIWLVTELPMNNIPDEFAAEARAASAIITVEEHVAQGSAGRMLAQWLLESGIHPLRFQMLVARGYASGLYGSQKYHRLENGLDARSVLDIAHQLGKGSR